MANLDAEILSRKKSFGNTGHIKYTKADIKVFGSCKSLLDFFFFFFWLQIFFVEFYLSTKACYYNLVYTNPGDHVPKKPYHSKYEETNNKTAALIFLQNISLRY